MLLTASVEEPSVEDHDNEWLYGFTCEWTNEGVRNHSDCDLGANVIVPGSVEVAMLANKEWHASFFF